MLINFRQMSRLRTCNNPAITTQGLRPIESEDVVIIPYSSPIVLELACMQVRSVGRSFQMYRFLLLSGQEP